MRFLLGLPVLLAGLTCAPAYAQSAPLFVTLGPADAALYKPDRGPAPHVAIVVIALATRLHDALREHGLHE
jgi:hypothetical protein